MTLPWTLLSAGGAASGPTLAVHDAFTDTSGTLLNDHTPTDAGTGWTYEYSTDANRRAQITATNTVGKLGNTAGSMRNYYSAQPNPSGADQEIEFVIAAHGSLGNDDAIVGLVRASTGDVTSGSAYVLACDAGETKLWKLVNGTPTQLGSTAPDAAVGSVMKLTANGSSIEAFDDGVSIISVTDSDVTQTGRWGIGMGNIVESGADVAEQEIDTFKAYDL